MKDSKLKVVIIRFSSLGDVILQLPIVSALKVADPRCHITYLTSKPCDQLIEGHPHIDKVLIYKKAKGLADLKSLWDLAKGLDADLILDLHGNTRSMLLRWFSFSTPVIKVDKRNAQRNLLIWGKVNTLSDKPHALRLLDELSGILNISFNSEELSKELNKISKVQKNIGVTSLPKTYSSSSEEIKKDKYIVVAPSASFIPKRWDAIKYKRLIIKILEDLHFSEYSVLLIAGPEDGFCEIYDDLTSKYKNRFFNLQGKTTLDELTHYIKNSYLTIGNDSVFGHISEAFGNPALSIFGPTTPEFGFKPHLSKSKYISSSMWCKPCSKTGNIKCFRDKQYCLEDISVDHVYSEFVGLMEQLGRGEC